MLMCATPRQLAFRSRSLSTSEWPLLVSATATWNPCDRTDTDRRAVAPRFGGVCSPAAHSSWKRVPHAPLAGFSAVTQMSWQNSTRISRNFATTARDNLPSSQSESEWSGEGNLSVDETLNKLFEEASTSTLTQGGNASSDAWYAAATDASSLSDWTPIWYNCADQAIVGINTMAAWTGLPMGWSIVATTVSLRVVLFPLLVHAQQASSRMAHVQPELTVLKLRYEKLGSPTRNEQLQFSAQMKALFTKHQVNPFKTMVAPLVQLPVFIGMFFGLQKMPGIFPETLSQGGMYWFVDLTVPDPLYILPVVSAVSFLGLIEMGKEQMMMTSPGAQGEMMVNVFRFMAIISLPFCASFEAAILCYWATNNIMTIAQTAILKNKAVRSYFGIWEAPKPVPGTEAPGLMTSVTNLVKTIQGEPVTEAQLIKKHNQEVEAQKTSFRLSRAARERRRTGVTGTRNM